ncbi:MAG: tryptophan synthase subunit beta, partial [Candidatus Bathyarchaeota archaeon]|nr:tryptophan synthase subunit beta [Candidatus Bathyarchaeota archaeon]
ALMQVLQDEQGQVMPSKTRSAGLNYPARGPEISHLCEIGRVKAGYSFDVDVFDAVVTMAKMEGMIPALETAHAVAYMMKHKEEFENDAAIILNYSGRGDKDIDTIMRHIYGT